MSRISERQTGYAIIIDGIFDSKVGERSLRMALLTINYHERDETPWAILAPIDTSQILMGECISVPARVVWDGLTDSNTGLQFSILKYLRLSPTRTEINPWHTRETDQGTEIVREPSRVTILGLGKKFGVEPDYNDRLGLKLLGPPRKTRVVPPADKEDLALKKLSA